MLGVPLRREGDRLGGGGRCGRDGRLTGGRLRQRVPRSGNLLRRGGDRLCSRCSGCSRLRRCCSSRRSRSRWRRHPRRRSRAPCCKLPTCHTRRTRRDCRARLEQHSTPRPQRWPNDNRRGTRRGHDDGLCSRRWHDDHATAGQPPRRQCVSLTRCRDARSHHHQHHRPQAPVARHGNTPCFTGREGEAPGTQSPTTRHHTNPETQPPTRGRRQASDERRRAPTPVLDQRPTPIQARSASMASRLADFSSPPRRRPVPY